MDSKDLSQNLIETIIGNENTQEIFTDIADFSFDQIVDSSLKEIPIIKHIFSIAKIGFSIRDTFLIKKILIFLKDIPKEKKENLNKFKTKINSDSKYSKKIGEHLIIILDRYDNLTKAEYLSKIFSSYLDEKINLESFMRLSTAIEKVFIDDLNNLNNYYKKDLIDVHDYILQNLYQSGLVGLLFNKINSEVDQIDVPSVFYVKNDLGVLLCNILFNSFNNSKLIVPMLNDLENRIFERICLEEDVNRDFNDFDETISKLQSLFNIDETALSFILSKFEKNNLIENTEQNTNGHYLSFHTSYLGYDYYYQKLENKKILLLRIGNSILESKIDSSSGYSELNNLSQRQVDHSLLFLGKNRFISTTQYSHGLFISNINNRELKEFISNLIS
jgi:hypothetical protein